MKFTLPPTENYSSNISSNSIDNEKGEPVGSIVYSRGSGRTITLLGKYSGTFERHGECEAFARGVAAVLNQMTANDKK